ncbi:MAG: sugar transferase [Bacteroidales bacterium]|nr:sugar transferase [Bacteroidales bacterium]
MVYTIYVGKSEQSVYHFKSLLKGDIVIASDHAEAERRIHEKSDDQPLMIFYEKGSVKIDTLRIEYIKNRFPTAYIVLVTDKIEKDEIPLYQRMGINDTTTPNVSEERLRNGIDFVARNHHLLQSASKDQQTLGSYKCPLWKRLFDITFSLAALIILSPLLIIVALVIAIESRGPVVYKSKRVGSNYIVFDFLKFRSMYKDADQRLKEFMSMNQYKEAELESYFNYNDEVTIPVTDETISENYYVSDDEVVSESSFLRDKNLKDKNNFVKYENDPRITVVGKFIRKFSIDELPQLINILKGDMSIVGNRPLPLYEAEKLTSDQYIDRFLGPSGLTGLWQVEKRGDSGKLSPEERKQLDIFYVKNYSFWMDIKIIFKTFTAFIQKENV